MSGELPPSASLDASWELTLERAWREGWLFGKDIVFTFGPLGFLYGDHGTGQVYYPRFIFAILFTGAVVFCSVQTMERLPGLARWVFIPWLAIFAGFEEQILCLMAMLAYYTISQRSIFSLWDAGLCLAAGVFSAIKINFILISMGAVCACGVLFLWRGEARRALLLVGGAIFFSGAVWLMCGQRLVLWPHYLMFAANFVAGYSSTQSLPLKSVDLYLALLIVLLLGALAVVQLREPENRRERLAFFGLMGFLTFAAWKHAVIRAGGHFVLLILWLPLAACLVSARFSQEKKPDYGRACTCLLALILYFGTVHPQAPMTHEKLLGIGARLLHSSRSLLVAPFTSDHGRPAPEAIEEPEKYLIRLPKMKSIIGREPVDVFHYQQGLADLNDFNLHPRPVLQSYTSFTPRLMALDWEFYQNSSAPKWLIFNLQTIDHHYPSAAPSRLLPFWLGAYELVEAERRLLLLRRKTEIPRMVCQPIQTLTANFNEKVAIPARSNDVVWCQIDLNRSRLGSVRDFLCQTQIPEITIVLADGRESTYRLPLTFARAGFLLTPHLGGNPEVEAWFKTGKSTAVTNLWLHRPKNGADFNEPFTVRLSSVRWISP